MYNKCVESLQIDKIKIGIYPSHTKHIFISYVQHQYYKNRISLEIKEKYINDFNLISNNISTIFILHLFLSSQVGFNTFDSIWIFQREFFLVAKFQRFKIGCADFRIVTI